PRRSSGPPRAERRELGRKCLARDHVGVLDVVERLEEGALFVVIHATEAALRDERAQALVVERPPAARGVAELFARGPLASAVAGARRQAARVLHGSGA